MNVLFKNKKEWSKFSETEFQDYEESLFRYYREKGFPYFSTKLVYREDEFRKIKRYNFKNCIDIEGCERVVKQTMHGLALCWSYHPHSYGVECNNKRSVINTFNDDDLLRGVIKKRIKFGDNMSDNGLRKMIKIFTGTQAVSNFRPTASASIYNYFCNKGDTVLDMSCGYGGRLLGSHLSNMKYIGFEPCVETYNGLRQMVDDFNMDATIFNIGSEVGNSIKSKSIDLCFTSPPYYNTEKYSNEPTQSYIKYPSYDEWLNGFMKNTLLNCKRVIKNRKPIIINIANTKQSPNLVNDVVKMATGLGLILVETWFLHLSKLGKGKGFKREPILIFKERRSRTDNG